MTNSVKIVFGIPEHGWLPVDLRYGNFHLNIYASDVLNDPVTELYEVLIGLQNNQPGIATWWLEPAAYFFNVKRKGSMYTIIISYTEDLHNNHGKTEWEIISTIVGDYEQVINPFAEAVKKFYSVEYEKKHWPYSISKDKLTKI